MLGSSVAPMGYGPSVLGFQELDSTECQLCQPLDFADAQGAAMCYFDSRPRLQAIGVNAQSL